MGVLRRASWPSSLHVPAEGRGRLWPAENKENVLVSRGVGRERLKQVPPLKATRQKVKYSPFQLSGAEIYEMSELLVRNDIISALFLESSKEAEEKREKSALFPVDSGQPWEDLEQPGPFHKVVLWSQRGQWLQRGRRGSGEPSRRERDGVPGR